jgi:cyclophilin family peptidyl-prolyl cis-trans isomerase
MLKSLSYIIFLGLLNGLWACEPAITDDNVQTVLTQYGEKNPETTVLIKTRVGNIKCKLYNETPLHRANFVRLVKKGYYNDNAEIYRVVHRFMIQGGDLGKLSQKQEKTMIPAEFRPDCFHKRGALAMARPNDNNPNKKSSPTEFFIVQGTRYDSAELVDLAQKKGLTLTPTQYKTYMEIGGDINLDQEYTVFGEVIEGMEIVDKIAVSPTVNGERPVNVIPLTIEIVK